MTKPEELPYLEKARLLAEVNLFFAQEELSRRIIDPTISTKALLEVAEHSFKVSGMAAKNAMKEAMAGPGFSITINIPQVGNSPAQSMVLESTARTVEDPDVDEFGLPASPAFLSAVSSGNLVAVATADE